MWSHGSAPPQPLATHAANLLGSRTWKILGCHQATAPRTKHATPGRHASGTAGPCPKQCNIQSTWCGPRHMGGARHSARCLYDAVEPSWAMVRCYSSSRQPIQYTACVGLLQLLTHNQLGHSARISRNRSTRDRPPTLSVRLLYM